VPCSPARNLSAIKEEEFKSQPQRPSKEGGMVPEEFGNMSSIMINPNEISNAMYPSNLLSSKNQGAGQFNFTKEFELEEKRGRLS